MAGSGGSDVVEFELLAENRVVNRNSLRLPEARQSCSGVASTTSLIPVESTITFAAPSSVHSNLHTQKPWHPSSTSKPEEQLLLLHRKKQPHQQQ